MEDNRACHIHSLNVGEVASLFTEVPRSRLYANFRFTEFYEVRTGLRTVHHAYDGKGYPPRREAGGRRRRDHALHDHVPHPVDKGNDSEGFDRGCRIQVASLADRVS